MRTPLPTLIGRGSAANPPNRFERLQVEDDFEQLDDTDAADLQAARLRQPTTYLRDTSRTAIASNDSPDVGFSHSVNPYRGCAHGCCYCYARPTHEYLGLSAGLDFETQVFVKTDVAALLRAELAHPRWVPTPLGMCGVTDAYQPVERSLGLTRQCLTVLAECLHPVTIVTKNHLVMRDLDLLSTLASASATRVYVSITTLDPHLSAAMEPRASSPARRLAAVTALAAAGVPVGVLMAPVVPGLTDHEIHAVVRAAADAGAGSVGHIPLRLPMAVAGLFGEWLDRHYPDRKDKVLNRVRSMRGGKLNDARFGHRMRGHGVWADQMRTMFDTARRRVGLHQRRLPDVSTAAFRPPLAGPQLRLF
jgi:DNA repair photolyase